MLPLTPAGTPGRRFGKIRSAFTLVEILLATALMTIVIMLVVQILATVMNAWGRANTSLEQNSEAALILDTIGRDLSGAVIRTDGKQKWFRHTKFELEGRTFSSLMFLSTPVDRGRVTSGTTSTLLPGTVSTVAYSVVNINPVKPSSENNRLNVICRYLMPPEKTYAGALTNFTTATWETVRASMGGPAEADSKSLMASNIYGLDVSYGYRDSTNRLVVVPSQSVATLEFPLVQSGLVIPCPEYFEITITILSSSGAERLAVAKSGLSSEDPVVIIAQESRQFSRRFHMPTKGLPLSTLATR